MPKKICRGRNKGKKKFSREYKGEEDKYKQSEITPLWH
jgi:hypothetical protein